MVSFLYLRSRMVNAKVSPTLNEEYYRETMRIVFVKCWRPTFKMLLHYAGLRKTSLSEITVDELHDLVNSGQPPLMIDVRSHEEYDGADELTKYGHIHDSRSIPILEFEPALEGLASYKDKEVVTMCPDDGLSLVAVEIMDGAGFTDLKSLSGGTGAWHEKGYPTTT